MQNLSGGTRFKCYPGPFSSVSYSDLSAFTADQLNELFVNARKQLFRATIPDCFDISDAVFHHNFVEFTAGTDQRAKNTYPYNFCTTGSKWRWRLDDADTIFPIDNQGQDRKPYHCEMHDVYSNGQPIWNGETSVFWNMLELAFSAEIAAGMRKMLSAMESLCGQSSGTPYDKVYAFYKKYYLGIKNYFPATLVNADAKRYEIAKIAYNNGSYTNDTDPITQSHGDFCSAETAWVKKRIMYIMSKYSYGLFSNSGTDTIIVRAAGDLIDYEITPAFDMYPAIANGTSIVQGARTKAGEVCRMTIDLGGSADQQNAIQAASWLLSIGDWHRKNVSGTMVVRGRRLTELILGSKTENVIITITGLTLADCGSLQKVLLSNIATLQGTLDLSACQNIREIYADGTGLSQIKVPEGGSLEVIEYPANNKYIGFRNFPLLSTDGLRIGQCAGNITDFWVENCPLLSPMKLLSDVIEAQQSQGDAHALKHIRAIGFNEEYYTADALDMLAQLSDGSYSGLSAEGLSGEDPIPVLEGTITVHSKYYQDTVDALRSIFDRLNLILIGEAAIHFKDAEARRICLGVWDADKDGYITEEEAAVQRAISASTFANNTRIASFNEFKWLNFTTSSNNLFTGCTSLQSIELPENRNIRYQYFYGCVSLERCIIGNGCDTISKQAFYNCGALKEISIPDTVTTIESGAFGGTGISEFVYPPHVTAINGLGDMPRLTRVEIGENAVSVTGMGNCPLLKTLIIRTSTPPSTDYWTLLNAPQIPNIYVPDTSVSAYKTASGWSKWAAYIRPISEMVEN